jgi:hypothetical protein
MAQRTISERVFESYLLQNGVECAQILEGTQKEPDYKVIVGSEVLIAEVKEFDHPKVFPVGGHDPLPHIRHKIDNARKQFNNYRDLSCGLILYNERSILVHLDPTLILCALFGEYYERDSLNTYRLSGRAKLRADCNTTISAVVALLPLLIHADTLWAARRVWALTAEGPHKLTEEESGDVTREAYKHLGAPEVVIRAAVVENPYARKPLSPCFFTGPFDEHWARREDGSFGILRQGPRIEELRQICPEYLLRMIGIW